MAEQSAATRDLQYYNELLASAESIRGVSLWQDAWKRLKRNRAPYYSLWFLVVLGVSALLTPLFPLQAPRKLDIANRQFHPPVLYPPLIDDLQLKQLPRGAYQQRVSTLFGDLNVFDRQLLSIRLFIFGDYSINSICGSDELGRDILSRLFWGARVSLLVGVVAAFVSLLIGVSYGAISGYLGGRIDNLMMRIVDVLYSIPFIFVVIFLLTILNEDSIKSNMRAMGIDRIMIFYVVIGAIYWLTMARVVRGQVLSLKHEQFVEAARTIGASRIRIIFRHLVPNSLSVVIVYLTLTIPNVMLFEAFLSFLGLGVEPPDVSWGLLANAGIRVVTPVKIYWWLVLYPGLALASTLFALNFLGDGLRDALDPRMKNRS